MVNGKAKLVSERYCDGLGACLGECPTGALKIVERAADDFDEEAVQAHLSQEPSPNSRASGCPSARVMNFQPKPESTVANVPLDSALSHWPVQIRLVPPSAPFLRGADLLVVADCVPIAYAAFQQDLLAGRTVMMGCPKFDAVQEYILKFADVFAHADIKSVTVAVMQVPCCQGLPLIVRKGMELSGKTVPGEIVIISLGGQVLARKPLNE